MSDVGYSAVWCQVIIAAWVGVTSGVSPGWGAPCSAARAPWGRGWSPGRHGRAPGCTGRAGTLCSDWGRAGWGTPPWTETDHVSRLVSSVTWISSGWWRGPHPGAGTWARAGRWWRPPPGWTAWAGSLPRAAGTRSPWPLCWQKWWSDYY